MRANTLHTLQMPEPQSLPHYARHCDHLPLTTTLLAHCAGRTRTQPWRIPRHCLRPPPYRPTRRSCLPDRTCRHRQRTIRRLRGLSIGTWRTSWFRKVCQLRLSSKPCAMNWPRIVARKILTRSLASSLWPIRLEWRALWFRNCTSWASRWCMWRQAGERTLPTKPCWQICVCFLCMCRLEWALRFCPATWTLRTPSRDLLRFRITPWWLRATVLARLSCQWRPRALCRCPRLCSRRNKFQSPSLRRRAQIPGSPALPVGGQTLGRNGEKGRDLQANDLVGKTARTMQTTMGGPLRRIQRCASTRLSRFQTWRISLRVDQWQRRQKKSQRIVSNLRLNDWLAVMVGDGLLCQWRHWYWFVFWSFP